MAKSIKEKRFYAIMKRGGDSVICLDKDLETVKKSLDSHFNVLVELKVTRLFTRNPELVEIEVDNEPKL